MKRTIVLSLILFVLFISIGQALAGENLEPAKIFFDAGEYKKSISLLKAVTRQEPSNTTAWVLLGNSFLKLDKNKKAINAYGQAIAIDQKNEEAFFGLGLAFSRMRKNENAIGAYKKVIEINPRHAKAHFELGVSHDRASNLSHAFRQYKILKTLDESLANKLYHIILGN